MAKHFSDVISEVMPLVTDRDSSTLFIISRDSAYGDCSFTIRTPPRKQRVFLKVKENTTLMP
jgi:hypothetical protein